MERTQALREKYNEAEAAAGASPTAEQRAALDKQWQPVAAGYEEVRQLRDAAREELVKRLNNRQKPKIEIAQADEAVRDRANEALEFLRKVVHGKLTPTKLSLTFRQGTREDRSSVEGHEVTLGEDDRAADAIHEIAHVIEVENEGVKEATQAFLKRRCQAEEPVDLSEEFPDEGFELGEMGRKDEFDRYFQGSEAYYIARTYADGGTEVLSKGLETMFDNPAGFAAADPDYFAFLFDVLGGRLAGRRRKG